MIIHVSDLGILRNNPGKFFLGQWHSIKTSLRDRFQWVPAPDKQQNGEEPLLLSWSLIELLNSLEHYDRRSEAEKALMISALDVLQQNVIDVLNGRPLRALIETPEGCIAQNLSRPLRRMLRAVAALNNVLPEFPTLKDEDIRHFYELPLRFCAELAWQLEKPPERRQPLLGV